MAVAINNMHEIDHQDEKYLDDAVRLDGVARDRYVSIDTCHLCKQGPGEACKSLFTGMFLRWTHAQPIDK